MKPYFISKIKCYNLSVSLHEIMEMTFHDLGLEEEWKGKNKKKHVLI